MTSLLPQCALISLSAPITRSGCLLQVSWCLWLTVLQLHSGRSTCRTSSYSVPCLVCTLYWQWLILKRLGSHKSTGFRQLFFFLMTTERHWITHLMTCHAWGITGGRVFSNRLNASNSQERRVHKHVQKTQVAAVCATAFCKKIQ